MRKLILSSILFSMFSYAYTQEAEEFNVELEALTITEAPGIQSYSWAIDSKNRWLIVGGKINGLHLRRPFESFQDNHNNKNAYVIDVENEKVYSKPLSGLSTSVFEQIQTTNQEFISRNGILYVFGGYGYSNSKAIQTTFPSMIAITIDSVTEAIVKGADISSSFFRQYNDSNFCVTGGQIGYLDSTFYLVGGQLFHGSYNPMGPNNGPGFTQVYTEEIRKFEIEDDGTTLTIKNYEAIFDTDELHRRDYNMSPQIFPNGTKGFTAFSGVFQKSVDLPFLNTVDITETGYTPNSNFNQYLSQYHSAKVPLYDSSNNAMQTLFFGGMSQYTLDENGNLKEDQDVPFVKTISKVVRYSDGTMEEIKLPNEMPGFLGSGAEYIPYNNAPYIDGEIVKLNDIPNDKTLIGYIFGGIKSTQENIFFVNDGTQSDAVNTIYKVYLNKSTVGIRDEVSLNGDNIFNLKIFPNPVKRKMNITFFNPNTAELYINLYDTTGKKVMSITDSKYSKGIFEKKINIGQLVSGSYILEVSNGVNSTRKTFIIN